VSTSATAPERVRRCAIDSLAVARADQATTDFNANTVSSINCPMALPSYFSVKLIKVEGLKK